jgi:hypothetical protein
MRRLGAAAVLAVLLAACGSEAAREPVDGGTTLPLAVHPRSWDGAGMAALVSGKVVLDEETGCVVLTNGELTSRALWPVGTTAQRDPFRLTLPDGTIVREGMWVEGGGGYLSADLEGLDIAHECLTGEESAVFNADETLAVSESGEAGVGP